MKNSADNYMHFGQYWDGSKGKWIKQKFKEGVTPALGLYPSVVDIDEDGDNDLLVGTRKGNVAIQINEGTAKQHSFSTKVDFLEADGKLINTTFHASVDAADFDQDGKLDIVVASPKTGVTLYRNVGEKGTLNKLTEFATLANKSINLSYPAVSFVDANGDGKLDVMVNSKGAFRSKVRFRNLVFYQK